MPMHQKTRNGPEVLDADEVSAYLRRNPNFLNQQSELFEILVPPTRFGDGLLDMQQYMIQRLQEEAQKRRQSEEQLIALSEANLDSQNRIHKAVLQLLAAQSLNEMIGIATQDLRETLDVDAIALCFETTDEPAGPLDRTEVRILAPGLVDTKFGAGKSVLLVGLMEPTETMFPRLKPAIHSEALVRLTISPKAPLGLLAMGSNQPERFKPVQGDGLLTFLGNTLSSCLRGWLELPK